MKSTNHDISRRSFLTAAGAFGAVATLGLAGCANEPQKSSSENDSSSSASSDSNAPYPEYNLAGRLSMSDFKDATAEPTPITEWDEEETYDIVVVGAGTGGVPAAIAAQEAGANVCLLQKESTAVAQGTGGCCFNTEAVDALGIIETVYDLRGYCDYRSTWALNKVWAENCAEAMPWYAAKTVEAGMVEGTDFKTSSPNGKFTMFSWTGGMNSPTVALADHFADAINLHYECPGIQLVVEDGRVTGVFAKKKDGSIVKITATKGVILATGDYQNNEGMLEKYLPNVLPFEKKQMNKTGDGHLMGMMAGGAMQTIGHTKMVHAKNWGANSTQLRDAPFLAVNQDGERFTAENVPMYYRNNLVQYQPDGAWNVIMDSNFIQQCEAWDIKPVTVEELDEAGPEGGVYKADTIEELAAAMGIPADAMAASVQRYNELCAAGGDMDFGKPAEYMLPVEQAPFYGLHKEFAVSAITSGLVINADAQVLDNDRKPIEGLYAIGNCSGPFYGSIDYPNEIPGMSVSRCITFGYVTGRKLAGK